MIEVFVTMIKAVCYMRMTKKVYLKKGVLSSQGQQSSYIFIFFSFTVCLSVWLSACLSLSLSVCLSGIGGGPGASHGPSAQYVPAGAEWRRCDSGETMEVLWLRQPRFSVTQGERTHTLRKHTEQTFKHVCVCVRSAIMLDIQQCVRRRCPLKQTLETVEETDEVPKLSSLPDVRSR